MTWLTISLIGYFLLAFSYILDKALLKRRIPRPAVYAFYVALLSFLSMFLFPFGGQWIDWYFFCISIFSGGIFIWGLLFYYYAVKKNEISRVAPLVGSVVQITTFLLAIIFLNKQLATSGVFGIILLIIGGFLISFDLPLKYKKLIKGVKFSFLSGIMLGLSFSFFDYIYNYLGNNIGGDYIFINGFMWTRFGLFIGGLSLLLIKKYRKNILNSFLKKDETNKKQRSAKTIFYFSLNKIFGGISSVLINYAILLGGASMVQAVSSVQFVFVLLLASLMMKKYPTIFDEKLYFWDWVQKIGAIFLIIIGVFLINK